jgi:uncharacterized damage-inducible protein DinB
MDWGRSYYREIFSHLENQTEDGVSKTMTLPWAEIVERELGRQPESISISETMLQIPMHSQYHRGQINARLRAVGGEPPRVDYIVWIWLGRPEADWDLGTARLCAGARELKNGEAQNDSSWRRTD